MTAAYDLDAHPDEQAYQALSYADAQAWLSFKHVTAGKPSERRYVVKVLPLVPVADTSTLPTRNLPRAEVIPFVTAIADVRGAGHLFPRSVETLLPPREETDQP